MSNAGIPIPQDASVGGGASVPIPSDAAYGQKMVAPNGTVKYAKPDEVAGLQASGHTMIGTDGSFYPQNIKGEDPLETEKRRQRIYKALTPEEKTGSQKAEISDAIDTGIDAVSATAAGVSGAGALGGLVDLAAAGGKALIGSQAVQLMKSSPKLYAEWLLKQPATKELAVTVGKKLLEGSALSAGGTLMYKWLKGVL